MHRYVIGTNTSTKKSSTPINSSLARNSENTNHRQDGHFTIKHGLDNKLNHQNSPGCCKQKPRTVTSADDTIRCGNGHGLNLRNKGNNAKSMIRHRTSMTPIETRRTNHPTPIPLEIMQQLRGVSRSRSR